APITPAVTVRALDSSGNLVTTFSGSVSITIGANPSGGALSGTTTVAAVNGIATFSNLRIDRAGNGYTLIALASGLASATSNSFNVTSGAATRLEFGQQPTNTQAGAAITPAVTVRALDSSGNLSTSFTGNVTITIGINPAGGTLSGTTTVAAVSGVATFSNLRIDKAGNGYTLAATATNLTSALSNSFDITAGPASQLVFGQQPSNTPAGAAITPPVTVRALDASGNLVTTFNATVTMAIGSNPAGGTLSGNKTALAVNGVATFSNLRIDKVGTGYTLVASATGVTSATSNAFAITAGAATQLVFSQQPTTTPAGATITPAVTVRAEDTAGNLATSFTGNVSIAIGTNPAGGTLSGTTTVAAVGGVATFSDLRIDKAGTGYTLVASSSGLTSATSSAFTITPANAARLVFGQQPSNTQAGAAITPAVTVHALDGSGNLNTSFTGNVTIAIGTNPAGGVLSGTTTVAAVGGVATFSNLRIDKAGRGYTLVASSSGLTSATSNPFDITPGAATQLVFGQQPTNTPAGGSISPAVTVRALDSSGNLVTAFTGNVTIAIGANPAGGALSGTTTVAAVGGVATFSNLRIDRAGNGYTLVASASGLTSATSVAFNITLGSATQLVFGQQPSNTPAGAPIAPAVTVRALDGAGNLVTSFTGSVTIAIGANPAGGTLSGTTTVAAVGGVATFSNLRIDKAGTGYTLVANSSGLTSATSNAFAITAGTATRLVFSQQPTTTPAGSPITPAVTVRAEDASGNLATAFNGNVSIAIGTNPAGGTLSGTTTVAAVGGIATFSNLRIDRAGSGYTLVASSSGLASATSNAFEIVPASAARLVFSQQPTNTQAGATITPPVTVRALDSAGNVNTSFTGNVTIVIGNGPTGSTLSGTTTVAAVSGVATFSNLSIDIAGTGYTLVASASGLVSATSDPFTITAAGAARLAFDQQPTNTLAGAAITPPVTVRALDSSGNLNSSFSGTVTIAIGTNPAGGTLSGTTTVTAIGGIATFSNLRIDRAGSGYTLVATAVGLASATSAPFTIGAGGGSGATTTITANPTSLPADGTSTSTITVQASASDGTSRTVGGDVVLLTTTAGTLGAVQDNQNGTYTVILTAPTTAATATISGTINGATIVDTATVTFTGTGTGATDLAVAATVSDPTPAIGDSIVYTITVSNQGPARATGVEVTDPLPARLTFVSALASQGSYNAQGGVWSVGVLEPGASATLEITARVQ
ncbi:MAG: beta strand repeat-containing protein, partial [Gemmatimonadota bacterium]